MNAKLSSILLTAGAVIVLLASILELTMERVLKESSEDALRWRLEEKVDTIWHLLASQYSTSPANKDWPIESLNFKAASELFWSPRDFSGLQNQLAWFQRIRVCAQISGGIMILLGTIGKKDKV
jgi:hypothetical protein